MPGKKKTDTKAAAGAASSASATARALSEQAAAKEAEEAEAAEELEEEDEEHQHELSNWCAKVMPKLAKSGEIRLQAHGMTVDDGVLLFYQAEHGEEGRAIFAVAPGQWTVAYAVDADGRPLAAKEWEGEIGKAKTEA